MAACTTMAAVALHLGTFHASSENLNSFNPGIAVRTQCGIQAGIYYNSYRKPSAYVAYVHDFKGPFWIAGGVVTGYPASPVLPMVMGGVRIKLDSYNLRIGYIPGIKKFDTVNMLHVAIEKRF
jgi:hypothetical protein